MYARMRLCTVHDAVYVCVLVLFIINFASTLHLAPAPTPGRRGRRQSAGAVPVV